MKTDEFGKEISLQTGEETFYSSDGEEIIEHFPFWIEGKPEEGVDLKKLEDLLYTSFAERVEGLDGMKIGVQLSGGLDSTYGTWLINHLEPDFDIHAYYGWSGEVSRDERRFARAAARHVDVPLNIFQLDMKEVENTMDEVIQHAPTTRTSALYVYPLYKKMAEDGVEVVVNFTGPDEFFGAYTIHTRYLKKRLSVLPMRYSKNELIRKLTILFGSSYGWFLNNAMLMPGRSHLNTSAEEHRVFIDYFVERCKDEYMWNTINKWLMAKVYGNYQTLLLPIAEHFGMDLVYPYMGRELIEYVFSRRPKEMQNKKPFREIMRMANLPPEIISRGEDYKYGYGGKVGWGVDSSFWLSSKMLKNKLEWVADSVKESDMFSNYVKYNIDDWIQTPDRRAIQLLLLLARDDAYEN